MIANRRQLLFMVQYPKSKRHVRLLLCAVPDDGFTRVCLCVPCVWWVSVACTAALCGARIGDEAVVQVGCRGTAIAIHTVPVLHLIDRCCCVVAALVAGPSRRH